MEWCGASLIYVDRWMVALPLITQVPFQKIYMALLLPISLKSQLNILSVCERFL